MTAKRAPPKKAKSKIPRASKSATKLAAEEKHVLPEVAETKMPEEPKVLEVVTETKLPELTYETTMIDVIEEPHPDVVIVEVRKIA